MRGASAVAVAALILTGCAVPGVEGGADRPSTPARDGLATRDTSEGARATTDAATAAGVRPDATVHLTMTSPREAIVEAGIPVVCQVDGRTYRASTGAAAGDASVSFELTGVPYRGAGELAFTGQASVDVDGAVVTVPLVARGAVREDLSGEVRIDTAEVALSLAWECG